MSVSPASDWAQRWTDGTHSWRHRSDGGFDSGRYEVAAITKAAAKEYVLRHHYSGKMPVSRLHYGLFDRDRLLGVAVLSTPGGPKVLTNTFPDLVPSFESLELGRFVLADEVPANGETWFLARAFRLAAGEGLRAVVSFSDPQPREYGGELLFPGHIGTIYQASNATYHGRSYAEPFTLLPNGTVLDKRAMQKVRKQEQGHAYVERELVELGASPRIGSDPKAWLRQAVLDVGAKRIRHQGKHRYVFTLGPRNRRRQVRIGPALIPDYPKEVDAA